MNSGPSCLLFTSELGKHFRVNELTVILTHCGAFVNFHCTSLLLICQGKHSVVGWLMDVCSMDTANSYKWLDKLATEQSRSGCVLHPQNFPSGFEN